MVFSFNLLIQLGFRCSRTIVFSIIASVFYMFWTLFFSKPDSIQREQNEYDIVCPPKQVRDEMKIHMVLSWYPLCNMITNDVVLVSKSTKMVCFLFNFVCGVLFLWTLRPKLTESMFLFLYECGTCYWLNFGVSWSFVFCLYLCG